MFDICAVLNEDHTDTCCFGVAVLSEGNTDVVYGIDGPLSINTFLKPIKECKGLDRKPKIVLFVVSSGLNKAFDRRK